MHSLIKIDDCHIENKRGTVIERVTWEMNTAEAWLVTGSNGGGKADFLNALSDACGMRFVPNGVVGSASAEKSTAFYANVFEGSVEVVSLERAARIIQEERENDESEYIEGGVDIGRTGRVFIAEGIVGNIKKGAALPEVALQLDAYPEIKLCGVQNILDRGLKYMSTGEIRRTLLARALVSKKRLLILSDPFAGLDSESRSILLEFFNTVSEKQLSDGKEDSPFPRIILGMERYVEIPKAITNVIEFSGGKVSFCGKRAEFEQFLERRKTALSEQKEQERREFAASVKKISAEVDHIMGVEKNSLPETLVEMNDVNVSWGEHRVLRHLNWSLKQGEHWLIQGPNGSGKTTFLELITGDNGQVFCNDVRLFGKRRGSGETVWDIKHRLGIVSYRLHVEYRMVGSSLLEVIVSGFHDSIGLYQTPSDIEIDAAKKWLLLGGFAGREHESFSHLSYGEQRAVLILRAAVKCPPILILDEPCHGLDEDFRQKILDLLEIIAESGTTTLLHVTHEMSEALKCERHRLELLPDQDPMYRIETV